MGEGIDNAKQLIARRHWRAEENQAIENAAKRGEKGGFVCTRCGNETPKLDINHKEKWGEQQREILTRLEKGEEVTRKEVLDQYGKNIEGQCPTCNRADNKLSAVAAAGVADSQSDNGSFLGKAWGEVKSVVTDVADEIKRDPIGTVLWPISSSDLGD